MYKERNIDTDRKKERKKGRRKRATNRKKRERVR